MCVATACSARCAWNKAYIADLERRKKEADSDWVQLLLRIEKECPSLGEKKHRAMFSYVVFVREHKNTIGSRKKVTARFMTKPAFLRFAQKHKDMTNQEAGDEWVEMLKNESWPRDEKGNKSALRLLIHMHDEVELYQDVSQSNILRAEEKPTKNVSPELSRTSETQKRKPQTQGFETQTTTQPTRKPVSKRNQTSRL